MVIFNRKIEKPNSGWVKTGCVLFFFSLRELIDRYNRLYVYFVFWPYYNSIATPVISLCWQSAAKEVVPYVDHGASTRPAKPIAESALSQSPLAQNVPAQYQLNRRPRHPKQGHAVKEKSTRAFEDEEDSRRRHLCGRSLRDSITPRYGSWKQRKERAISEAVYKTAEAVNQRATHTTWPVMS